MAVLNAQDWVAAALRALEKGGVRSVRVESLCRELGVTKGSFYHHFKRRQDLLDGVLQRWIHVGTERIIHATNAASRDPVLRLLKLMQQVFAEFEVYDDVDAGIREWAASDATVAEAVAEVDGRRLGYVRDLLEDAGVPRDIAHGRAEVLYKVLIGELTWRRHGGPKLSTLALRDMVALAVSDHRDHRELPRTDMHDLPAAAVPNQSTRSHKPRSPNGETKT